MTAPKDGFPNGLRPRGYDAGDEVVTIERPGGSGIGIHIPVGCESEGEVRLRWLMDAIENLDQCKVRRWRATP